LLILLTKLKITAMIRLLSPIILLCLISLNLFAQKSVAENDEVLRPQFHFTTSENYLGNPVAAIFADSLYHLFYEYSPVGNYPEFLQMGHAVSKDLLHWDVWPVAVEPDDETRDVFQCTIRPGSALVDSRNVLGKQKGDQPALIVFYTSFQCGIRMAYSTDKGKTWEKFGSSPLISYNKDENARDPKVFWYEPDQSYVMAVARDPENGDIPEGISFFKSKNLIDWEYQSHYIGPKGRPDVFQLPDPVDPGKQLWVLTDSIGSYMIGGFDGVRFRPETDLQKSDFGVFRDAVTWSVPGKGANRKVIQIASIGGELSDKMPFAGQLSIPAELNLAKTEEGMKLIRKPVETLETLQGKPLLISDKNVFPGLDKNPIKRIKGDCFRLKGTFQLKTVNGFGFIVRTGKGNDGAEIQYNALRQTINCMGKAAVLKPMDGKIELDILVDRSSIEVFANQGEVSISATFEPAADANDFILYNSGGELFIEDLKVYPLTSVYQNK